MPLTINLENAIRHSGVDPSYRCVLEELVRHLKELRDRSKAGDSNVITEFFALYKFDDSQ